MNASVALQNIATEFGDQVGIVSIYSNNGYPPFYNPQAHQKIRSYPPPDNFGGTWGWAVPWLWLDGDKHAAYQTSLWLTRVTQRVQVPSPLVIQVYGIYDDQQRQLSLTFEITNTDTATITGQLHGVLTEDDIHWPASNGLSVHYHIPRIWWPNYLGMEVTLPPGNTITRYAAWQISSDWVPTNLRVVAFVQDVVMQPDSTFEVFQGFSRAMLELQPPTVINPPEQLAARFQLLPAYPNPFNGETRIKFYVPEREEVKLVVYNPLGQIVRELHAGWLPAGWHSIQWDGRNARGEMCPSGLYFLELRGGDHRLLQKLMLIK